MHPFTFLSIILHKYKAFTQKSVYWKAVYRSVPESWQNVHNAMCFIRPHFHDIVHTICVMSDKIAYHSKNNAFQSYALAFCLLPFINKPTPTPWKKYSINNFIQWTLCSNRCGENITWNGRKVFPLRFVFKELQFVYKPGEKAQHRMTYEDR